MWSSEMWAHMPKRWVDQHRLSLTGRQIVSICELGEQNRYLKPKLRWCLNRTRVKTVAAGLDLLNLGWFQNSGWTQLKCSSRDQRLWRTNVSLQETNDNTLKCKRRRTCLKPGGWLVSWVQTQTEPGLRLWSLWWRKESKHVKQQQRKNKAGG